jgi:hypothetical protein
MNKLKAALVESYAGAILIAMISSTGIVSLVQWLFGLINLVIQRSRNSDSPMEAFPASAIFSIVHGMILLGIAFLLLRWLYFPTQTEVPGEDVEPAP